MNESFSAGPEKGTELLKIEKNIHEAIYKKIDKIPDVFDTNPYVTKQVSALAKELHPHLEPLNEEMLRTLYTTLRAEIAHGLEGEIMQLEIRLEQIKKDSPDFRPLNLVYPRDFDIRKERIYTLLYREVLWNVRRRLLAKGVSINDIKGSDPGS